MLWMPELYSAPALEKFYREHRERLAKNPDTPPVQAPDPPERTEDRQAVTNALRRLSNELAITLRTLGRFVLRLHGASGVRDRKP